MASVSVGDEVDNPVGVNVTPLVDIIFCLCVFFMISFKFKQLEGRFEAWLPKTTGLGGDPDQTMQAISDVRVALFWDETTRQTVCQFGSRRVADDAELEQLLLETHEACVRLDQDDIAVTIDADRRVPWSEVVDVMNLSKRCGLDKIAFALQAPPAEPK